MRTVTIRGRRVYARLTPGGMLEVQYFGRKDIDSDQWFFPSDSMWQGFSPEDLRKIADLKEKK